jgi:hypothetical protein
MITAIFKRDQTSELMQPLNPVFQESIESALNKLNTVLGYCPPISNRTKASLLYDLVKDEIKSRLAENKEIEITEKWSSMTLVIDSKVAARVKKLNNVTGLPSNIKTKRVEAIIDQTQYTLFPEYPLPTNICIGYVINDAWTQVLSLRILCVYKDSLAWQPIDITKVSDTEPMHFITNEEEVAPRVTPKKKQGNE